MSSLTTNIGRLRSAIRLIPFCASMSLLPAVARGQAYFVQDLGTLGGTESYAQSINNVGQAVGWAQTAGDAAFHAFRWDGAMHDLAPLSGRTHSYAIDINDHGVAVGFSTNAFRPGNDIPTYWDASGIVHDLGLPLGPTVNTAAGINNAGQIVGGAGPAYTGFLWQGGSYTFLSSGVGRRINDSGQIAMGWNTGYGAYLYSGGAAHPLGSLGGSPRGGAGGDAGAINSGGAVVASSSNAGDNATHAYLWLPTVPNGITGAMQDLGTLGGTNSASAGINDFAHVVGWTETAVGSPDTHAFLYHDGAMTDLNTLIPDGSGWVLQVAADINNGGQIVGWGSIGGKTHAFILQPTAGLTNLSVTPNILTGGNSGVGRITLSSPHITDMAVSLSSSVPARAGVPAAITVPAGQTTLTFPVTTPKATADSPVIISAMLPGVTKTAPLIVTPTSLVSVTVNPVSIIGGKSTSGAVKLSKSAPAGGWPVGLSSGNAAASVPATVVVPAGSSSVKFTVATTLPNVTTSGDITASFGGASKTAALKVLPITVVSLTLTPSTVKGGEKLIGKVTISGAAPVGGKSVTLACANGAATCPASVLVPAGKTSATFTITTVMPASTTTGDVTATAGGVSQSVSLTVNPPVLSSLMLSPTSVTGGTSVTGTVATIAVGADTTVTLKSANAAAHVPANVVVMAGATSATFNITTDPVLASVSGAISASYDGVTKSVSLMVKAPTYLSFTLTPSTVKGGNSVTGLVTMSGPVAVDTLVTLTNLNAKATLPGPTVTIPAGQDHVSFNVTTAVTAANVSGAVKAQVGTVTKSVTLKVTH